MMQEELTESNSNREAQVQMIANDIRSGNVKPLQIFLQTSIDEEIDADSERQAKGTACEIGRIQAAC